MLIQYQNLKDNLGGPFKWQYLEKVHTLTFSNLGIKGLIYIFEVKEMQEKNEYISQASLCSPRKN